MEQYPMYNPLLKDLKNKIREWHFDVNIIGSSYASRTIIRFLTEKESVIDAFFIY